MWSNLVNQVSDMASQAVNQASEVASQVTQQATNASEALQTETDKLAATAKSSVDEIGTQSSKVLNEVKESFKDDMESSKRVEESANQNSELRSKLESEKSTQQAISEPLSGPSLSSNQPDEVPENIKKITDEVDQMADKLFTFASSWAGKAYEATTETAKSMQTVASTVTASATEKLQVIQDHELVGAAIAQTKKISEQVVDTIENKTIIGDFNKEQQKTIEENQDKNGDENINGCPWEGYDEWEILKEQILNLSKDKRTFVRNPPAGVSFTFEYQKTFPQAMAVLKEDENLQKMRFELVPKKMKEANFWKNYFYRVSLIKQSFTLKRLSSSKTSLNNENKDKTSSDQNNSNNPNSSGKLDSLNSSSKDDKSKSLRIEDDGHGDSQTNHDNEEMFISNEFGAGEISAEDLQAEMAALGMENNDGMDEDWEKQLNQELAEYEIVDDGEGGEGKDVEDWEKEVNDMLT